MEPTSCAKSSAGCCSHPPASTEELRAIDPTAWVAHDPVLKDVRDMKECQLLSNIIAEIGLDRLPQAIDLMAARIREIRMAKGPGGSWDKAAAVSLMPGTVPATQGLPDGAMEL